jgi:3-oxoacyl-[acyl-carrier-protein] synthase II
MSDDRVRVVITGMGAVTPLGQSVDEYWQGLLQGRSGIGPMTLCDPEGFPCRIAGEVDGFDPGQYINPKEARRMARFSQLAVAAAGLALEDAGLNLSREDPERLGVVMGNGIGGFPTTEENARTLVERVA